MSENRTTDTALSNRADTLSIGLLKDRSGKTVTARKVIKQRCWPYRVSASGHPTKPDIDRCFREKPDLTGYTFVSVNFRWPIILSSET